MLKSQLLLATGGADGNGADAGTGQIAAKKSTPSTTALPTLGISDSLEHLDVPEALKASIKKSESTSPQPSPQGGEGEAEAAAKLEERAKAAGRTSAEQKTFEEAEAAKAAAAGTKPEFTTDEQAWLDLRAKATTPEEIAELDKQMPEFSQEKIDWINAQADAAEKAEGEGDEKVPEFSAEQKPFVDKLTQERDEFKTKFEEAESKRTELEAEVAELSKGAAPAVTGNLHPLALVDDATAIDTHEENLEKFIAWGKAHWDGSEAMEKDGKVEQRAYTAKEIREAVAQRETELRKLIPAARGALQSRQAHMAEAKKIYPALFDAKSPDSKLAAGILKQFPFIKTMPNFMTIIGDAIAGERARTAAASKNGKGKTALRIPPRPPKAGAGAPAARIAAKPAATKGPDVNKFIASKNGAGGEMAALTEVMKD